MRKISKTLLCVCLFLSIFALSACNPASNSGTNSGNESEKTSNLIEDPQGETQKVPLAPMVRIEGKLYQDTGYVNSCLKCGTADGEIKSSVSPDLVPTQNDQSNFGEGFEYQFWKSPYINVKTGDYYWLFEEVDEKSLNSANLEDSSDKKALQKKPIPDAVAHFTATVQEVQEDALLVTLTEISEEFDWIFRAKGMEEIKPISLPIENLNYAKDGKVTTQGLQGKSVEVWFNGSIREEEPEKSNPIILGQIYRIDVLE